MFPIIIDITTKHDPGQFPPSSIDHHFTFTYNGNTIYLSNPYNNPE